MSICERIESLEKTIRTLNDENHALWDRVEDFEDEVNLAEAAGNQEDVEKFTRKMNRARVKAEEMLKNLTYMRGYLEGLKEAEHM